MEIVGRGALASLFLLGALNKVLGYGATLDQMRDAGLPAVEIALPLVIALEAGGGAMVAFARPLASAAALVLAGYTLLVNAVFHPFWNFEGERAALELSLFFKNVSIAGGLLYVAAILRGRADGGQPGLGPGTDPEAKG
ncbi:MAG: DoxX family protein [Pseudomonadota bacterium]